MKTRIQERLLEIEAEHGFEIIYACESGSRAWGFTSEDSDYDVRFIYKWSADQYLSVYNSSEQLDLPVDSENLDFSGWDFRKSLSLFRKSNGAMMEWLYSPIVYFENETIMSGWRHLVPEFFVPHSTFAHYYGLAKKMRLGMDESKQVTAKKYLYILRALLSARHIVEHQCPPPVLFATMLEASVLDDEVVDAINLMIDEKVNQNEKDSIERQLVIDQFVENELIALDKAMTEVSKRKQGSIERLDQFFRASM